MILPRSRARRRGREDEAALGIEHRGLIYGPNEKSRVVVHRQPVLQLLVQSNVKTPTCTECPASVGKRVGIGNVPAHEGLDAEAQIRPAGALRSHRRAAP